MRRNILSKAIVLFVLLSAFGCKVRKPVTPVVVAPVSENKPTINKADVLNKVAAKQVNFNTIVLKAKAELTINKKSNDVVMNIRMQKGKVIWASVSHPLIGEVARALITPDSIKIMNKFENTYTRKPFEYIYEFANDQVDFITLQNIFIGDVLPAALAPSSAVTVNGGQIQIKGNLEDLVYLMICNDQHNLIQSNLRDEKKSQSLTINYGEYQNVGGQDIPQAASIQSNATNKSINIDLHYTQITINEATDFPFNVPKRYTVKD